MANFEASVGRVKEIISSGSRLDALATKQLFAALFGVFRAIDGTPDAILVSNPNLAVLEDLLIKNVSMGRSLQCLVVNIYGSILAKTPGYAVRNTITSMLSVLNSKTAAANARECSAAIIGEVMKTRSFDCGSLINDVITCLGKVVKGSDNLQRIIAVKSLTNLVIGAGTKIGDCHVEIMKLASKYSTDRMPEVRVCVAGLIAAVASSSAGCSSVSTEVLVMACTKGLEDEIVRVQDAFAIAVSAIFHEQIRAHQEAQEQAKIDLARGVDDKQKKKVAPRSSITALKAVVISQKKIIDDYDVQSVITHIIKQIVKPNFVVRGAYLTVLTYLVRDILAMLTQTELEWLINEIIGILQDPVIAALTYEELVLFRTRLGHLLRSSIIHKQSENGQLIVAAQFTSYIASVEVRSEQALQLALNELSHVIIALGEAAVAALDEIHMATTVHLRHSSFGVRSAASHVLASIANVSPLLAARFMATALTNARTQAQLLTQYDVNDLANTSADSGDDVAADGAGMAGLSNHHSSASLDGEGSSSPNGGAAAGGGGGGVTQVSSSGRRRSPKEVERLQRMFCFHGHTLVISVLLKNEKSLPTGLPKKIVLDVFDFGLELLKQDVASSPAALKHVSCSLVRAGSLIISSCLHLGYSIVRPKLLPMLVCCDNLFRLASADTPATPSSVMTPHVTAPAPAKSDDRLLYELMCVEAGLVCVSSMMWFCSDALIHENDCLTMVIEGLECAFRAVKGKYQPMFRTHFRFRTLHAILLECFAWLPPGSFPNTCQQVFVEALRVFRDSLTAGFECSCLSEFVPPDMCLLTTPGSLSSLLAVRASPAASASYQEYPQTEDELMQALEYNAIALQKKEGEAFLAIFGKATVCVSDDPKSATVVGGMSPRKDWYRPTAPSGQIDSRTVDSSIGLIAATFGHQTPEYQEKAVQLCSQAFTQLLKAGSSMSMFSSDEEKRKKERRNFVTTKNIVSALSFIVRAFPVHRGMSFEMDLAWGQTVVDHLYQTLIYGNLEVRMASSSALALFAAKVPSSGIINNTFSKINTLINTNLDKKSELVADYGGNLLALGYLWRVAGDDKVDVKKGIITCVLNCLRKIDTSAQFRAHGILAVALIVEAMTSKFNRSPGSVQDDSKVDAIIEMMERSIHAIELQLVSVTMTEDSDLILGCTQRFVNACLPLLLHLVQKRSLPIAISQKISGISLASVRIWEIIRRSCNGVLIVSKQCTSLLTAILPSVCNNDTGNSAILPEPLVSRRYAAMLLMEVLDNPAKSSASTVQLALNGLMQLVDLDVEFACQIGLDVALFKLLNWCLTSAVVPLVSAYSGLELRCSFFDPDSVSGAKHKLQTNTQEAILSLIHADVAKNPNSRASYWVLVSRAVALGLRMDSQQGGGGGGGDGGNNQSSGRGDDGEDDGDDNAAPPPVSASTAKNAAASTSMFGSMTYQQFATRCRDAALEQTQCLPATRIVTKSLAVQCATAALSYLLQNSLDAAHSDIASARAKTTRYLIDNSIGAHSETTLDAPAYAALFMHDIINLSCACATFTINDKRVVALQKESSLLLQCIIGLFANSVDPDAQPSSDGSGDVGTKILHQFVSQLLSAIRPSLIELWCPSLLASAGPSTCQLIRHGFLNDKVVIRRVAKIFLGCLDIDSNEASKQQIGVRAIMSLEVSENISASDHVVKLHNIALLHLLTAENLLNLEVEKSVKSTIATLLSEHLSLLSSIWFALVRDSVAMEQSPFLSAEEKRAITYASDNGDHSLETSSSLVTHAWPEASMSSDPHTGGLTYNHFAEVPKIEIYYHQSLCTVLAALTTLPISSEGQMFTLFAVSQAILQDPHKFSNASDRELVHLSLIGLSKCAMKSDGIKASDWSKYFSVVCSQELKKNGRIISSTILDSSLTVSNNLSQQLKQHNIERNSLWTWLWCHGVLILCQHTSQLFDNGADCLLQGKLPVILHGETCTMSDHIIANANTHGVSGIDSCLFVKLIDTIGSLAACGCAPAWAGNYAIELLTALISAASTAWMNQLAIQNLLLQRLAAQLLKQTSAAVVADEGLRLCRAQHACECLLSAVLQCHVKSSAGSESAVELLLAVWLSVASSFESVGQVPQPIQLSAVLLQCQRNVACCRAVCGVVLKTLQTDPGRVGGVLITSLLPAIICTLTAGLADASSELLLVQVIFLAFGAVAETQRAAVVAAVLSPLCSVLCRGQQQADRQEVVMFCGKGLTHIARLCPEAFRDQISLLSDPQKVSLQDGMRKALAQQQVGGGGPQTGAQSSSASASEKPTMSFKKIDSSRFKK